MGLQQPAPARTAVHRHSGQGAGRSDGEGEPGLGAQWRDGGEFARLAFTGLDLVPPGVVLVSEWRPGSSGPRPTPAEVSFYGGVARKR